MFLNVFKRKRSQRMRALMRGYRALKKVDGIGRIRGIKEDLSGAVLSDVHERSSKIFFGASLSHAEQVTRQFLLQRNVGAALNREILYSLGARSRAIVCSLPVEWQQVLTAKGFRVDARNSTRAFWGFVLHRWIHGVVLTATIAAWLFPLRSVCRQHENRRYAYLDGLTTANLPQPRRTGQSYDICSWYAQWEGRAADVEVLCHDVKGVSRTAVSRLDVEYRPRPYCPCMSVRAFGAFAVWGVGAIIQSLVDVFRGRWWHATLLAEAAKAKAVQVCDSEDIAVDYLFHYSGNVYRPMWTYEAEAKGARILCYFYSTSEQVKLPSGYVSQRYEWGVASWPTYLVWDEWQATLMRKDIGSEVAVEPVGPIWFSDSEKELPNIPPNSVAVFDVEPHRRSAHFGFSTLAEYENHFPGRQAKFLQDIYSVLSERRVNMVFKGKRNIGNRGVKSYRRVVESLSRSEGVIVVDSGIAAIRVVQKCDAIISMPFTSTSLLLRERGIPSAYYDPTGWIQKDDRGAHGIPVITGIEELRAWVLSVLDRAPTKGVSCIS